MHITIFKTFRILPLLDFTNCIESFLPSHFENLFFTVNRKKNSNIALIYNGAILYAGVVLKILEIVAKVYY